MIGAVQSGLVAVQSIVPPYPWSEGFESGVGLWTDTLATVTKTQSTDFAHAGTYSCKLVGSSNPSTTTKLLPAALNRTGKTITVDLWGYRPAIVTTGGDTGLVVFLGSTLVYAIILNWGGSPYLYSPTGGILNQGTGFGNRTGQWLRFRLILTPTTVQGLIYSAEGTVRYNSGAIAHTTYMNIDRIGTNAYSAYNWYIDDIRIAVS